MALETPRDRAFVARRRALVDSVWLRRVRVPMFGRMTMRFLCSICLLAAASTSPAQTPERATPSDRDAVQRAALSYIEGFYEGDTAKLVSALRPELSKYGFWRDSTQKYSGERMTYTEAIEYAKRVKSRNRPVPASWPKEVKIFEVLPHTAAVKVTAWWGTDYLLLGKFDGRWMIRDVLWESPPSPNK